MNSLLPYCGLVDTKIRASDKDLPALRAGPTMAQILMQSVLYKPGQKATTFPINQRW